MSMEFPVYRFQKNNDWVYTLEAKHIEKDKPEQAGIFTLAEGVKAKYVEVSHTSEIMLLIGRQTILTANELVDGEAEQFGYGVYKSVCE